MKKYLPSCLLFMVFEVIAVVLWLTRDNLFYLLNFTYIGGCIALGTAFFAAGKKVCQAICPVCRRFLYADLSRPHLAGEHAD